MYCIVLYPDCQKFSLFVHAQHGITQTSELVNVSDFFNSHIVPDLQAADGEN